jgi:hypothetical protein
MRRHILGCMALLTIVLLVPFGGCSKSGMEAGTPSASDQGTGGPSAEGKPGATTPAKVAPPEVVLETSKGAITIRLNPEKAPRTVENFLGHVKSRFYDQTVFHRVEKDQRIIGGIYNDRMEPKTAGTRHCHDRFLYQRGR